MNAKNQTIEKPKDAPPADDAATNLPSVAGGRALAVVEIDEEDRGAGLKNIKDDERKIPFLRILQSNSPECEEGGVKYLPGAKAGLLINTATKQLYSSLIMVPCARDHKYIEYVPRAQGSGFVGIRKPDDETVLMLRAQQGKFGKLSFNVTKRNDKGEALDGTEIVESYEIYAILIDPETGSKFRAVIPFQSTQIGKYQVLVDRADNFEYAVAGVPEPVKPAFFSHKWLLAVGNEKNKKGSFKGYVISLFAKKPDGSEAPTIESFIKKSDPLFAMAKAFGKFVEAGQAEVDYATAAPPEDVKKEDEVEM